MSPARPDLTAERFVEDPFSVEPQARMYRTGDLGRWRADGAIEYLGRNDHQVKIRGFRIEIGEIEAHIKRHPQVNEAVVIARDDAPGQKRLAAYVIPEPGADQAPSVESLRSHLKTILPEYMVPSAFVMLERLPLTSGGKLDRRALPLPELGAYGGQQYEAPRGKVEEILAGIWQELLQVERVGRQDNFFELGGHSLQGMKLVAKLSDRIMVRLPVFAIFRYPTIETMSEIVESLLSTREAQSNTEEMEFEEGTI